MSGLNRGVSGLYGGNAGLYGGNAGLYSGSAGLQAGGGTPSVAFLPENRAATIALSPDLTTAGDSITFGVGSATTPPTSWPTQLLALTTSGSILRKEVSGMALRSTVTAQNPSPIPGQVSGQGATPLGANTQVFDGGLNDYNTVVVPLPNSQAWVANASAGVVTAITSLTGGASQFWTYQTRVAEERSGPGMRYWSDWTYLTRTLRATYGARIFDIRRYLQFCGTTNTSDLDYTNVNTWWGLPLTFRGMSTATPANLNFTATVETAWNTTSTATNTPAGIEIAAPASGFADGDLIQNINAAAVLGANIFRKCTAGSWVLLDEKHMSQFGNAKIAQAQFDVLASIQGLGAPMAPPSELYGAQDCAANTTVGTIYYSGAAPATAALFDSANNAVTTLSLTDNGSTNNLGSITAKRSAAGSLTEGLAQYVLQLTDGSGHVLHSPVDFYVGQPSTQTTPRMWTIPGSTTLPSGDFSMYGREVTGLNNTDKFFFIGWVNPSTLAGNQYLFAFSAGQGNNSSILVRISATGQLAVVIQNSASTILTNAVIANVFTAGTNTWFAIDVDLSVATPTIQGFYNKAGAGADVGITATGVAASGPSTVNGDTILPRFFSLRDASVANQNFVATDANRSQFHGKFGNLIAGNGNIGIAGNTSLARTLWNLDNTPAARVPFATIGGITPVFDIQGGVGDLLYGGFDQNNPVHGTYRGIVGLT